MKRIFLTFAASALIIGCTFAQNSANNIRIYLNAGHGSWGPDDRPMATIPYPALTETGRPDTCGFYESNTNLWKVLKLGQKLIENGFSSKNIVYSRTQNGPYPYKAKDPNGDRYNRSLSEICEEVEAGNFDMFLSVHSNAASEGAIANYALFLYRGKDDGTQSAPGSRAMCKTVWPYIQTNGIDYYTSYSTTSPNIRGDIDFYHNSFTSTLSNGKSYTGYLGVLKHGVPGFLSEGYFHTYQPARHRALNKDYCGQEGIRYLRGILKYFNLPAEKVGYIMGTVKDSKNKISNALYTYKEGTDDQWFPINGAKVQLLQNDTVVDEYTTDGNYNGVFVFSDLTPGIYTLQCSAKNYTGASADVYKASITVTANQTTYRKIYLTPKEGYVPTATTKVDIGEHKYFAYNLSQTSLQDKFVFSFSSNGEVSDGNIILTDTTTREIITIPVAPVIKGTNTVQIDKSELKYGIYSWSVSLNNTSVSKANIFFNLMQSHAGNGVAIQTNTAKNSFGTIFFANSYAARGLYALSPDLKMKSSAPYFANDFTGEAYSPGRIAINPYNNYVYVSDWSNSHGGIYNFSAATITPTLSSFLRGTHQDDGTIVRDGQIIGGSTSGISFAGPDKNPVLYAFVEDYPKSGGNQLCRYDIAHSYAWLKPVSKSFPEVSALMLNHNVNLFGQTDGVWLAQTRNSGKNTADVPALVYIDLDGNILFNSGKDLTTLDGCDGGGIAINKENNLLAIVNGKSQIEIYNLKWIGGVPKLSRLTTLSNNDGTISQMAFDYAGNLYVSCRYANKGYVLPYGPTTITTPSSKLLRHEIPAAISDIETATGFVIKKIGAQWSLTSPISEKQVKIYSAAGILLKVETLVNGKATLNTSQLPKGIYIVKTDHFSATISK